MPSEPENRSNIRRRAGGSIEDRIRAARARRQGHATPEAQDPTAEVARAPDVHISPPENEGRKTRPLLLTLMLAGLAVGLAVVALAPPPAPPSDEDPPRVVAEAPAFPGVQMQIDPPEITTPPLPAFRLSLAPVMPLALPTNDPLIVVSAPIRTPQPPTAQAPTDTVRPRSRPTP